jgi:transposase InsO family protein
MGFNSIWVIIDRFTVSAQFILVHGVLKTIISDPGPQFVARFREQLLTSLGMHLIHSSAYHLQTDGQIERVNQILEDML